MAVKKPLENKRRVGYITLDLVPPDPGSDTWTLKVDRLDPHGGEPWQYDFYFEDEAAARRWFRRMDGDDDLDHLIRNTKEL